MRDEVQAEVTVPPHLADDYPVWQGLAFARILAAMMRVFQLGKRLGKTTPRNPLHLDSLEGRSNSISDGRTT